MARKGNVRRSRQNADASTQVDVIEAAIGHLSDAAKLLFRELNDAGTSAREQDILYFHRQGEIFKELATDQDTYAKTDSAHLRAALQLPVRQVNSAMDFAAQYTGREVKTLVQRVNPTTRRGLTTSHIQYLLSVPKDKHEDFITTTLEKSLTARELHKLIKSKLKRPPGHGRTPKLPESLEKQVQQINDHLDALLRRQQSLWNGEKSSVFANIQAASADRLHGVIAALEHMRTLTDVLMNELSRNLTDSAAAIAAARTAADAAATLAPMHVERKRRGAEHVAAT